MKADVIKDLLWKAKNSALNGIQPESVMYIDKAIAELSKQEAEPQDFHSPEDFKTCEYCKFQMFPFTNQPCAECSNNFTNKWQPNSDNPKEPLKPNKPVCQTCGGSGVVGEGKFAVTCPCQKPETTTQYECDYCAHSASKDFGGKCYGKNQINCQCFQPEDRALKPEPQKDDFNLEAFESFVYKSDDLRDEYVVLLHDALSYIKQQQKEIDVKEQQIQELLHYKTTAYDELHIDFINRGQEIARLREALTEIVNVDPMYYEFMDYQEHIRNLVLKALEAK